jgi:hypothetical protein
VTFAAGQKVVVRSKAEILATLDDRGCFEQMPFMPQMLEACGKTFHVSKSAHKLCDTVNGTGARQLTRSVFLDELRCDGQLYGGCEMECMIVWKDVWLRAAGDAPAQATAANAAAEADAAVRLAELAHRNVRQPERQIPNGPPVYSCQATQMPAATLRLSVWEPRQYLRDLQSGNASIGQVVSVLSFLVYDAVATSGLGIGSLLRGAYDLVQWLRGGAPYPARPGKLPRNSRTPSVDLGVQAGEIVKVKTQAEVLETVTEDLVNRGMGFHPEMVPYCGQSLRVGKRLQRIMNEKTGQVMELKNQCLVLEGAPCNGLYTKPLLCPRGMYPYWREIWLERVPPAASGADPS